MTTDKTSNPLGCENTIHLRNYGRIQSHSYIYSEEHSSSMIVKIMNSLCPPTLSTTREVSSDCSDDDINVSTRVGSSLTKASDKIGISVLLKEDRDRDLYQTKSIL